MDHKLFGVELSAKKISEQIGLVENSGLEEGADWVWLRDNPLSVDSCTVHIPELESRGVTVVHDCP